MDIEEEIINIIRLNKEGILQKDIWKCIDIDRRKCSRIINKLYKEKKIIKISEPNKNSRTYRIKLPEEKKPKKSKDFKALIVGDMFSPCTGCRLDCIPEHCPELSEWIFILTMEK